MIPTRGTRLGLSEVVTVLECEPPYYNRGAILRCLCCGKERRIQNLHQFKAKVEEGDPGRCLECMGKHVAEVRTLPRHCETCGQKDPIKFRPGKARECMKCAKRRQRRNAGVQVD